MESKRMEKTSVNRTTNNSIITLCCNCNEIRLGEEWYNVDQMYARFGIKMELDTNSVSHGICPECYKVL